MINKNMIALCSDCAINNYLIGKIKQYLQETPQHSIWGCQK